MSICWESSVESQVRDTLMVVSLLKLGPVGKALNKHPWNIPGGDMELGGQTHASEVGGPRFDSPLTSHIEKCHKA